MNGCATQKQVLLIGDTSRHEFQDVVAWIAHQSRLATFPSIEGALDNVARLPSPDVIVLVQSWPGQWSAALVESLHREWPLARLVAWLGSWCEGETRSGRPCRGVWRVYWYDFQRRMATFLTDDCLAASSSWNLPRLSTDADRLACDLDVWRFAPARTCCPSVAWGGRNEIAGDDHVARLDRQGESGVQSSAPRGLVVIGARDRAAFESLSDACECMGFATAWQLRGELSRVRGEVTGIWDALDGAEREWRQIADFARRIAPANILITIGFPRPSECRRASEFGARVLAKPFQLPDLWYELQRATGTAGRMAKSARSVHPANCSTL